MPLADVLHIPRTDKSLQSCPIRKSWYPERTNTLPHSNQQAYFDIYTRTNRFQTYHTQTSALVLVNDVRQDLTRCSNRNPLLVSQLVHSTLHSQVSFPIRRSYSALATEHSGRRKRGELTSIDNQLLHRPWFPRGTC
jgi:hypothetical protein